MYGDNADILIEAKDVWNYFTEHRKELLEDMIAIAENTDFDVTIYLTNEDDLPYLIVESDNINSVQINIEDEESCGSIVQEAYKQYLTENILSIIAAEQEAEEDIELIIEEREGDIDGFILRLLEDLFGDDEQIIYSEEVDDIVEDCKEHFLEYLYRKHNLSVYRPMELEDDEGVFFEEYPYEYMNFEPNPLYEKDED